MSKLLNFSRLTDDGIEALWAHIEGCRADRKSGVPIRKLPEGFLSDRQLVEDAKIGIAVDAEQQFPSRFEFAKYIAGEIGSAWSQAMLDDVGLWAWLAVIYWAQFTADGVNRQEHYIPIVGKYVGRLGYERLDYRSCTRTPLMLLKRFGDQSKFFLKGSAKRPSSMASMGDLIEQTLGRQEIFGNTQIMKTIMSHYADENGLMKFGVLGVPARKKLKNGKWSRSGYGQLRRLIDSALPTLKLTFHVDLLAPREIVELAGPEFTGTEG